MEKSAPALVPVPCSARHHRMQLCGDETPLHLPEEEVGVHAPRLRPNFLRWRSSLPCAEVGAEQAHLSRGAPAEAGRGAAQHRLKS